MFAGKKADAFEADYMKNQQVVCNVNAWQYNPQKYWPDYNLDFYAYYPYSEPTAKADATKTAITAVEYTGAIGAPVITYSPGSDPKGHLDIMRATALNRSKTGGVVGFEFKHCLAKVGFKLAEGEMERIRSISLSTDYTAAKLDLGTGKWTKADSKANSFVITETNSRGEQINPADAFIYMVPETGTADAPDKYTVSVEYEDGSGTAQTFEKEISPGWEGGKHYSISLAINDGIEVEAMQEDLHIRLNVSNRNESQTYKVKSVTEVGSTTNLLKAEKTVDSDVVTIGVKDFDFLAMKNDSTYTVVVEDGAGKQTKATFDYNWVEMGYTLTEATTELPFHYYNEYPTAQIVAVCGTSYTDEVATGKDDYGWTSTPTSTKYILRSGQTDYSKIQIAILRLFFN